MLHTEIFTVFSAKASAGSVLLLRQQLNSRLPSSCFILDHRLLTAGGLCNADADLIVPDEPGKGDGKGDRTTKKASLPFESPEACSQMLAGLKEKEAYICPSF